MTRPASETPVLSTAEQLNRDCHCLSVDHARLQAILESDPAHTGLYRLIRETRPHLFADVAVFVSSAQIARMAAIVAAVEETFRRPRCRERALARAGVSARHDTPTRSVFLAYDFHLAPDNPQLIEINTNGGGAYLNAVLAGALRAGCPETAGRTTGPIEAKRMEQTFVEMFRNEWRLARGAGSLTTIAIVDDRPAEQYLYPEFLLAAEAFRRHGLNAVIADAADLRLDRARLWHGQTPIDLVYNRLTDFGLDEPGHTVLREAWLHDAAVITPHPRAHALYADKRNLILLSDEAFLGSLGLPAETLATLQAGIPRTVAVDPARAEEFWQTRRQWFFKPAAGFGSRAAYRGDKLTRRVWSEIVAGNYVAQQLVVPGERHPRPGGDPLKFDVRAYVYDGEIQLFAARLYRGQTTNFRTAGGGFAPVFYPPAA